MHASRTIVLGNYIKTFYGYGNYEGDWWLIGMEEGGGDPAKWFTVRSVPPLLLPDDVERRRVGNGHHRHHPGLHGIGDDEIGDLRHAAGLIE
jgi:hypothetical protein